MPLYLVTHHIEVATAKVPFFAIILQDHIKRKSLPPHLRIRLVLPTDSTISVTVWDAPGVLELSSWLDENLDQHCVHQIHEVQEECAWGVTNLLASVRAAEKVALGGRSAVEKITATAAKAGDGLQRQLEALDQRTNIITAAGAALTRVKAAASSTLGPSGSTTGATRTSSSPPAESDQDMMSLPHEQPYMSRENAAGAGAAAPDAPLSAAAVSANVQAGLSKAAANLSWFGTTVSSKVKGLVGSSSSAAGSTGGDTPSLLSTTPQPSASLPEGTSAPASRAGSGVTGSQQHQGAAKPQAPSDPFAELMGLADALPQPAQSQQPPSTTTGGSPAVQGGTGLPVSSVLPGTPPTPPQGADVGGTAPPKAVPGGGSKGQDDLLHGLDNFSLPVAEPPPFTLDDEDSDKAT